MRENINKKGNKMYEEINIEKLREDLINYYGTAMYNSSPIALKELIKVEKATATELISIAQKNKINIDDYKVQTHTKIR